ncbi:diaminobutyrate acetyltransferase [Sphingobium quisquiliarum]|nr:diaminobutyrate acetyltransferase [Sphingobium quisquiliarum]
MKRPRVENRATCGICRAAPFDGLIRIRRKYFGRLIIFDPPSDAAYSPPRKFARQGRSAPAQTAQTKLRLPTADDGPSVTRLIASCPPLDVNSAYCNLLQCTHFAQSCIIAERAGTITGWVSSYRPPSEPDSFFVWQVAVAPEARGQRLAARMIEALLARPAAEGVTALITTVTNDNRASWSLFEGLASRWGASLSKSPLFHQDTHFAGAHATEWLARIGPLPRTAPQPIDQGELAT